MWTLFLKSFGMALAMTPHCLGMCGGFPLHLAKESQHGRSSLRQALFVLGKGFTYVFLGAVAGALGVVLLKNTPVASAAPILRITTGALTIIFGLLMLGFRLPTIKALQPIADAGIIRTIFGGLLINPSPGAAFTLGLAVGFLPCPLPIGMLFLAAASNDVLHGMVIMAGVALGTAPGLIATGLLGAQINRKFARSGMRIAGIIVLAIGILTLARATGLISPKTPNNHSSTKPVPACCGGESR